MIYGETTSFFSLRFFFYFRSRSSRTERSEACVLVKLAVVEHSNGRV